MAKKYNYLSKEDMDEMIWKALQPGADIETLAEEYNVSVSTIHRNLRDRGRGFGRGPRNIKADDNFQWWKVGLE